MTASERLLGIITKGLQILTPKSDSDGQHVSVGRTFIRHMQDDVISTSVFCMACARFSLNFSNSADFPRFCKHSTSPCSAQTLFGWCAHLWIFSVKPRSSRYASSASL